MLTKRGFHDIVADILDNTSDKLIPIEYTNLVGLYMTVRMIKAMLIRGELVHKEGMEGGISREQLDDALDRAKDVIINTEEKWNALSGSLKTEKK